MTTNLRSLLTSAAATVALATSSNAALFITGVFDGPLSGGTPKVVELYASTEIADLSTYTVDYYFNANATSSLTVPLSGSAAAGQYFYLTPNATEFGDYFGFAADYTGGSINGDDSIVLLNSAVSVDVFGMPGTDGTGLSWEYLDGWAYRKNNTGPSTTFSDADWIFSGINATDGDSTNATSGSPFPIGTFAVPEPSIALLSALGVIGLVRRRR